MTDASGDEASSEPSTPGKPTAGEGARYTGLGIQIAVTMSVCVFGGSWLDKRFGTDPWLTLVGAVLGFASVIYLLLKIAGTGGQRSGVNNSE